MVYEIKAPLGGFFKHTFNYQQEKKNYEKYANMPLKEFKKCLKDRQTLGNIGHLTCHILATKELPTHEYTMQLRDHGLIHLLWHCVENKYECNALADKIQKLFKLYVKLS